MKLQKPCSFHNIISLCLFAEGLIGNKLWNWGLFSSQPTLSHVCYFILSFEVWNWCGTCYPFSFTAGMFKTHCLTQVYRQKDRISGSHVVT